MSRRLRAKLPTAKSLLKPQVVDVHHEMCNRQTHQKHYYDRGTRPLPPLKPGDSVRYKRRGQWATATVVDKRPEPRSYNIRNAHGQIRRNRRQLYKTVARQTPEINYDGIGDTVLGQSSSDSPVQSEAPQNSRMETRPASAASDTRMSSFSRPMVPPVRFRDFVC